MRSLICGLAAIVMLAGWGLAQGQDDLPSAPSAVKQQEQKPPAPPPPAQSPAPAKPAAAPVTDHAANTQPSAESMEPPKNASASTPASTSSQRSDAPGNNLEPDTETIKVPVNEVNLIFTATDKHGHFVKDLKQQDVKVVDDHKPVDKILSFHAETDLPLRVGLLIDASNSIRERFKFEQESAIEFLSQIVRPKTDQAFVLGFDTVSEVTQDFTNDTEKLAHGIRVLRPGGGTALYDALYSACRDKLMKMSAGEAVRRAVILVSDGEDNQSRVTREEAIAMAQKAEVIVYTISTNTSGLVLKGDKVLQRIADETGGRAFFPFKIEDVADAFQDIQEELRSQYALAYKPPDFQADGRYRSIEVVADNKKTHIRARKGYFSPTQQ